MEERLEKETIEKRERERERERDSESERARERERERERVVEGGRKTAACSALLLCSAASFSAFCF